MPTPCRTAGNVVKTSLIILQISRGLHGMHPCTCLLPARSLSASAAQLLSRRCLSLAGPSDPSAQLLLCNCAWACATHAVIAAAAACAPC